VKAFQVTPYRGRKRNRGKKGPWLAIAGLLLLALILLMVRRGKNASEEEPSGIDNGGISARSATGTSATRTAASPGTTQTAALNSGAAQSRRILDLLSLAKLQLQLTLEVGGNPQDFKRENELLLTFNSDQAYRDFLARMGQTGLRELGRLDTLRSIRVGFDSPDILDSIIPDISGDLENLGVNPIVRAPAVPTPEQRSALVEVPFGDRMMDFLGASVDRTGWGQGVTIAVLDSGVAPDTTFGSGRLSAIDIGFGLMPGAATDDGHGTAVASLAAGESANDPGLAPAASLLSIRVTDATGLSDMFTLSQAIVAAVDAGANIINISMGGYQTGAVLSAAVDYATAHNVVIVASAGNDQAAQLTWPAANPAVVAVGAVDAIGQQVLFSNSGDGLDMMAPGYGVTAAWLDNAQVSMDGTSASAPLVSGAIAAVISQNPWMTPSEALQLLEDHASEGGPIGTDPSYGNGILNIGSTMNRQNASYIDTAIASHYIDSTGRNLVVVVQNRSSAPVSGMQLVADLGGSRSTYSIPILPAGVSAAVRIPFDQNRLQAEGSLRFVTQLTNAAGIVDAVPSNNRRASTLFAPVTP